MARKRADATEVAIPTTYNKVIWTPDVAVWCQARDYFVAQLGDKLQRVAAISTIEYGLLEILIYEEEGVQKNIAIARGDIPGTKKPSKFWTTPKE